ncbi:2-oxoglutarate dehydrogenase E1 subunit family protein, partial [Occultella aeris]|uniref:2-oxoglutarate dehydrogenase E1 subunit family protein n=1 Tax=Occultella aeris TaxID=2761496 RepID=UPI0012EAA820
MSQQAPHDPVSVPTNFGGNEWLIDELYAQYREDKSQVDPTWWEFFENYRPADLAANGTAASNGAPTAKPAPAAATKAA